MEDWIKRIRGSDAAKYAPEAAQKLIEEARTQVPAKENNEPATDDRADQ